MTNPGAPKKPEGQRKDLQLLVAYETRHDLPIRTAARMEGRAVTDYIRFLTLSDMQAKGLLNDVFEPIEQVTDEAAAS